MEPDTTPATKADLAHLETTMVDWKDEIKRHFAVIAEQLEHNVLSAFRDYTVQQDRKNANYALVQQQIQLAQAWRQQLRQQVLDRLSGLGRDAGRLPGAHEVESLQKQLGSEGTMWFKGVSKGEHWGIMRGSGGVGGAVTARGGNWDGF